jgi:predicted ATPase/class 3 adenylate cyclase
MWLREFTRAHMRNRLSEAVVERKPLPSGTVTFLFTDIEGSTERWERHRDLMREAVRRHDDILQSAITAHDGYVFKTVGDAFCATFRTAPDAIGAALEAQRALAKEDFSAVDGLKVRMAVHTGLSYERSGDYFGPTVNRVARLLSIGHGGQILVSGTSSDLAQGELPSRITFRDLGAQRLKDLAQPEQVYQVIAPDLPQEFPPLRSLDALPNNLPLQITSFVGRDEEIQTIEKRLQQARLLTLVGSGGVGKTRLALQVGADLLDQYEDGVWLVEFAPLSDPDLVPSVVAGVLGVAEVANRSLVDSIVYWLKPKHTLLILDNCEHVVEPAAKIVDAILRGCPHVRLMVASRQGLGMDGETVHRVASLSVPEHHDGLNARDALQYGALALFAERAAAAVENFSLTDENADTVAQICRRLDGIALAIELAAPRLKALSLDQLLQRLNERFRLLTGGKRTALQRQQTMRALIDWSYDLLAEAEKRLLWRVAIFAGGWTLDGATEVCSDENIETWDVIDLLTSLVDKSLVTAELQGTSPRYRLGESTREYALEKLDASGERQKIARKHAEYFSKVAQKADATFNTMPLATWIAPLVTEIDNFRAALDWTLGENHDRALGAALAGALEGLWIDGGMEAEGGRWVNEALSAEDGVLAEKTTARLWRALSAIRSYEGEPACDAAERACALYKSLGNRRGLAQSQLALANGLFRMGRNDEMKQPLREAHATFLDLGDTWWLARCLDREATLSLIEGEIVSGRKVFKDALEFYQAHGDDAGCDRALANLAELEFQAGNVEQAIIYGREAQIIDERLRRKSSLAIAHNNLAAYRTAINQLDEARADARAGLRAAREAQAAVHIAIAVQHLGLISAMRGEPRQALRFAGFATTAFKNAGSLREPTEQQAYDRLLATVREHLSEDELSALLAEGATLSEDQVVEEALRV